MGFVLGLGNGIVFRQGGSQNWSTYWLTREPILVRAEAINDTSIVVTWIDPVNVSADGIKIFIDGIENQSIEYGIQTATISGLDAGTKYVIKVVSYKGTNISTGVSTYAITFSANLLTLLERFTEEPENQTKNSLNELLYDLDEEGFTALDYLVCYGLDGAADSLINIFADEFNHTIGAADVTHTPNRGYIMDGDSGYINAVAKTGDKYATQFDNFWGLWVLKNDSGLTNFGGSTNETAAYRNIMYTYDDTLKFKVWNNASAANYSATNDAIGKDVGFFVSQRPANYVDEIWHNGCKKTLLAGGNRKSGGITGVCEFIGATNRNGTPDGFCGKQYALAIKGKSIGDNQLTLFNILQKFLQNVRRYDYFVSTASDWATMYNNINTAIYYNGKTYVVFQDLYDDPYIISYDHTTYRWSQKVRIGNNLLGNGDGHGEPALLIDDLGYFHVFYGCHYHSMSYAKSNSPEDISAWTEQETPVYGADGNEGATYPQASFHNGIIYLFYRGGVTEGWRFKTSSNRGATWSEATDYIVTGNKYYSKTYYKNGKYHTCYQRFPNLIGTGYDVLDLYYAYMNPSDGIWRNIDGDALTLPLNDTSDCKVYDSGEKYVYGCVLDVDENNKPYIFFSEGTDVDGTWDIKILRLNGTTFEDILITTTIYARNHPSAIDIRSTTKIQVFPVISESGIGGDIEKWESNDAGATWTKISTILSGKFLDPVTVYNCKDEARIVVFTYKGNSAWDNDGYMFGDYGFV